MIPFSLVVNILGSVNFLLKNSQTENYNYLKAFELFYFDEFERLKDQNIIYSTSDRKLGYKCV